MPLKKKYSTPEKEDTGVPHDQGPDQHGPMDFFACFYV